MRVDDFDFDLPEASIALRPASPRDAARMLLVSPDSIGKTSIEDRIVRDLPSLLRPGDALVVNDTKVVPARLFGLRRRGDATARIEVTLHRREGDALWKAFARPAKRLVVGETMNFEDAGLTLVAEVVGKDAGEVTLRFDRGGRDLEDALHHVGRAPLPPYIEARRVGDAEDESDYQTIFAKNSGAVAAPTAGLHFTPELLDALDKRGIVLHRVTLHVGAGTFLPVKVDTTDDHVMHAETGAVVAEVAASLNEIRRRGGRIVAVGTTSLRILESATTPDGMIQAFAGDTSIFITPGYRFRAIDGLMTNFHLPRSTLFMLVSAFAGLSNIRAAYAHAIASGYRFYSYGDASLLWRLADPTRAMS